MTTNVVVVDAPLTDVQGRDNPAQRDGDRSHAKTKINHRRQQRTLSSRGRRRRENPIKYTLQACN